MPFHDLNIASEGNDTELSNTLAFLHELGYTRAALSISVLAKLPAQLPQIDTSNIKVPNGLKILRRMNLTISDTSQNHRINNLVTAYDLLAVRPTNEKAFQLCCSSLDCDIVSLDLSVRLPYPVKFKTVAGALQRGIRFEICYSNGITGGNDARRNLINGAASLIRATRGRGIIVSSEAHNALGLRAPHDVINLATVWGLSGERAKEAVCEEAGLVVKLASLKRSSFRGVVDIIEDGGQAVETITYGGKDDNEELATISEKSSTRAPPLNLVTAILEKPSKPEQTKRKASQASLNAPDLKQQKPKEEKPLSNREKKRQAKKARLERALSDDQQQPAKPGPKLPDSFSIQHEVLLNKKNG